MKADQLFQLCNMVAPMGWLLLIVAPRWTWTHRLVVSGMLPLALAVIYLGIIVTKFGSAEGDFGSLEGVSKLFENPYALTAGWIHYLAFDMLVGGWEVSDSQKHGIAHWKVIPCLILTFMFGPIGFLLYHAIRVFHGKKFYAGERLA